jgi:bacteriorhodopsin
MKDPVAVAALFSFLGIFFTALFGYLGAKSARDFELKKMKLQHDLREEEEAEEADGA